MQNGSGSPAGKRILSRLPSFEAAANIITSAFLATRVTKKAALRKANLLRGKNLH